MRKKKILMLVGGEWHPFERCGEIVKELVEATGRYELDVTADRGALERLSTRRYAALLVYTTGGRLTKVQEKALAGYIKSGGALIGVHGAAASWRGNAAYVDLLGGVFAGHGPVQEFPVTITGVDSAITRRMTDFRVTDELYVLGKFDPKAVDVLATAMHRGKVHPMAYTKTSGKGKVFYLALGHDERSLTQPEFQKLLVRGLDWALGRPERKPLKAGVIGYGAAFHMGKLHLESLRDAAGFEPVAVCDLVAQRRKEALDDFPGIETYASAKKMLDKSDVDLVAIITEHWSHAKLAVQCLDAGRHVVTEKPFCITVKEADAMIASAKKNKRMLSVFHNRRWDGDYLTIRDIIRRGLIGDVFHMECGQGNYRHPTFWWRSDPNVSGTILHDWGAHFIDWMLNLVPGRIKQVMGDFQKRVWHSVGIEDHGQVMIWFEGDVTADYWISSIAAISRPKWLILGTKGAIQADWGDELTVVSYSSGIRMESKVKVTLPGYGSTQYYRNVADHLLMGEELAVTPEQARRVIGVIDAAQRSWQAGASVSPAPGCE